MSSNVLRLLLVLLAASGGAAPATRLRYPAILGEQGAGTLLGPSPLVRLGADDAVTGIERRRPSRRRAQALPDYTRTPFRRHRER
jgi:hypothetical protein